MRCLIGLTCLLLVGFALPLSAARPEDPAIVISIGQDEVRLENVGRMGALLFGATLKQELGVPTQRRFAQILEDPEADGRVTFKPEGGTPLRGIWVAIDRESGSMAVAGRQDYKMIRLPFPHGSAKRNTEGQIEALEEERLEMDMVVVRPGVGVWILRSREGETSDGDVQRNGRLRLTFENARSLDGTTAKAPKHLKKDDVVAAIDIGSMEVFATALEN